MKNFFIKLLCIFAFILSFSGLTNAADLNISSVTFDNSATFMAINSQDNDDNFVSAGIKLNSIPDEKKVYFDIPAAILRCAAQDLVIQNSDIKEVLVKQFSANPNVVRVVIYYNDGYNPSNIQLKRLNNSLFVRFGNTQIQNFYFQQVYNDISANVNKLYETTGIQVPVTVNNNNLINQINSAFKLGDTTEDKNYILSKKDLSLPTKYYLDNITVKNGMVHLTGIGTANLTKPFALSNPIRVVYDIPNTVVNPTIRNKDISINQYESVKVGQFNQNTARVVITSQSAYKYIPVIYADTERIVFIDKDAENYTTLFTTKAALTSANSEIFDTRTQAGKLVFSKPLIYGIDRDNNNVDIYLLNVDRYQDINIKSILSFEGVKISALKHGGAKISIPLKKDDELDIHAGADGKTLRIKIKYAKVELPAVVIPPVVKTPTTTTTVQKKKPATGKKVIVIDPGHGGSDVGATRNGIYEKNITLDVSKKVVDLLRKKGYQVYMTRDKDETVSLQDRVAISENISPDVFVSIHVNSSNSDSPTGLETHYYKDNSLTLAKNVHASLLNHVNSKDRGLFKSKFYVINHTTAPAILVEIGFISSPIERAQLVSESRKQATAKAITEGIDDYFKK